MELYFVNVQNNSLSVLENTFILNLRKVKLRSPFLISVAKKSSASIVKKIHLKMV